MNLSVLFSRLPSYQPPALVKFSALDAAAGRIFNRWPDVIPTIDDRDRDALVQLLAGRLRQDRWDGIKLSLVTKVGRVVFDADFRDRPDLADLRAFYLAEIRASTRPGFLSTMVGIYIGSYVPGAPHTRALAKALEAARDRLGVRWQRLLQAIPALLDPTRAPVAVAQRMGGMGSPYAELKAIGLRSPHAPGLMDHAHLEFLKLIEPGLRERAGVDRLFDWLKPEGLPARQSGASQAIEAVLKPWRNHMPPAEFQRHLVEALVSLYRDPRTSGAAVWTGVDRDLLAIMMRWLTGENIEFFLDVVSEVEESHMWAPRRRFWLGLHERGLIDEAWVAFSPAAAKVARQIRAQHGDRKGLDFGLQEAGGGRSNTSLLILRLGTCIVVEGSHSFKVHIFPTSNSRAPTLFKRLYDCEGIRRIEGAERIVHIGNWQARVMQTIGFWS